jgi:L-ascorbate metabolism protein UlaG (beta-lactamase superfamily)
MKITYYGHSCFGVVLGGKHLLFDPFITPNELARQIDLAQVPADIILISHGHEDHLADVVAIAQRTRATILCNFEIYLWLSRKGLDQFMPMNVGGTAQLGVARAKMVNAIHSSALPDGANGGNPAGWVIESAEGNFYFSGDTALTLDMKIIGESSRLNFAVLCIGDTFTMGVDDAIRAADWVGASQVLGVHYDTFPPIKINHAVARQKFAQAGKTLHLPAIGETLDL